MLRQNAKIDALLEAHGFAESVAGDTDGDAERSAALLWVAELLLKKVRQIERRGAKPQGTSKTLTPNDQAQGEAQGSSRLSPGATGSTANGD